MPFSMIVHIFDEDPVIGEVEVLPANDDFMVKLSNPRRLDGKELHYVNPGVAEVFFPIHRISFIELIPTEDDEIIGFVRE